MPLADPIEYQILRNLQSALQQITVAGGYHYDVASVAVKIDPNHDVAALIAPGGPRPFVLIEVKPGTWTYAPAKALRLLSPLTIHWVSDSSPTVDESLMQTFFNGCADVEKAIAGDISRGGLASDTRIVKREYASTDEGAQVWALIDIEIGSHRVYGSPNG